jgi:hypothetical protein
LGQQETKARVQLPLAAAAVPDVDHPEALASRNCHHISRNRYGPGHRVCRRLDVWSGLALLLPSLLHHVAAVERLVRAKGELSRV